MRCRNLYSQTSIQYLSKLESLLFETYEYNLHAILLFKTFFLDFKVGCSQIEKPRLIVTLELSMSLGLGMA